MKYLSRLTLGVLLTFIIMSCENDEDNSSPNNYIKYENKKYELSQGYVMYNGPRGDVFRYNPVFYSSDIKVYGDSYVDSLSGNGNAIGFQLHTKRENLEGAYYEYQQDLTEDPYIFNGSLIVNANVENAAANEIIISDGTLFIIKFGESYTFELEGTTENGKDISFYYKDSLTFYEDEGVQ